MPEIERIVVLQRLGQQFGRQILVADRAQEAVDRRRLSITGHRGGIGGVARTVFEREDAGRPARDRAQWLSA
ncbi:MAG: hypothetical protein VB137_07020 [Burkholderia sp.]